MSSEALLISIISGLLMVVQLLVSYIFKSAITDLKERINRQDARFEQYVKDKERFDYEFRHDEYAQRVSTIEVRLGGVEHDHNRVEQLWRRAFDGDKRT
jgi:uncharacterized Zn finger protein